MNQVIFFKKKVYLQIKSKESPPKIIKRFITKEEVKLLLNIEKNSKKYFVDRPDGKKRSLSSDGSSTDRDYRKWNKIIRKILVPKLKKYIGDFTIPKTEFPPHYFTAIHPTRLHVDTGRDPNMFIGKQILIPLEIQPKKSKVHTILFKDRWYGPASNFEYSNNQNKFTALKNISGKLCFIKNVTDFKKKMQNYIQNGKKHFLYKDEIFFLSNELVSTIKKVAKNERYNSNSNKHIKSNRTINTNFYKKYLTHHSIKDFNGLTPELAYKWKVGEALIWDRSQLHCSDDFGNTNASTKTAIAVFTNYKN